MYSQEAQPQRRLYDAVIVLNQKKLLSYANTLKLSLDELKISSNVYLVQNESNMSSTQAENVFLNSVNIWKERRILYLLVVKPENENDNSVTVSILENSMEQRYTDYRNVPLGSALVMIARNFLDWLNNPSFVKSAEACEKSHTKVSAAENPNVETSKIPVRLSSTNSTMSSVSSSQVSAPTNVVISQSKCIIQIPEAGYTTNVSSSQLSSSTAPSHEIHVHHRQPRPQFILANCSTTFDTNVSNSSPKKEVSSSEMLGNVNFQNKRTGANNLNHKNIPPRSHDEALIKFCYNPNETPLAGFKFAYPPVYGQPNIPYQPAAIMDNALVPFRPKILHHQELQKLRFAAEFFMSSAARFIADELCRENVQPVGWTQLLFDNLNLCLCKIHTFMVKCNADVDDILCEIEFLKRVTDWAFVLHCKHKGVRPSFMIPLHYRCPYLNLNTKRGLPPIFNSTNVDHSAMCHPAIARPRVRGVRGAGKRKYMSEDTQKVVVRKSAVEGAKAKYKRPVRARSYYNPLN